MPSLGSALPASRPAVSFAIQAAFRLAYLVLMGVVYSAW